MVGLELEDDELIDRLVKRGKESGRSDDNPETIKERLKVYHTTTQPLREYYINDGSYKGVRGHGSVEDIFSSIRTHLDALKANEPI